MGRNRTATAALLGAMTLILGTAVGAAEPTGPEVLAKVDQAINAFNDAIFESKLQVKTPGGDSRTFAFTTWQKSPNKRLERFSSPGDVAGMGVLIENESTMYVFLPGFQKVRRMGTHIRNQTFMGSDFSFEDMSQTSYAPTFDAKLTTSDANSWTIELTAKAGVETEFPKATMVVEKKSNSPLKIDYFDASGKLLKTQTREGYHQDSPKHWQPGSVTIVDHRRNDHTSEITFTSTKIDSGLSDAIFSVRSLVRGN